METIEIVEALGRVAEGFGIIGVLIYAWLKDRKRADNLEDEIIEDWKRTRDRP